MKTALITTTINIPKILLLYSKFAPMFTIFVAGDLKTPPETEAFCGSIDNCVYLAPANQKHWLSSELIGWNTDSRRNFALLEALRWGAELIITIDDDMIPYRNFAFDFLRLFENRFSGLQLGFPHCWLDHGQFTVPPAPARGLSPEYVNRTVSKEFDCHVYDVPIGIAQGIILGVPDTDAMTAISSRPFIHSATDILRNGFVANPECYAVVNSQITAFRRCLAPFAGQFYRDQGRNTDIMASIMMRNEAKKMGLYTYYGPPMGFHARKPRSLFRDLEAEMFGLRNIDKFARNPDVPDYFGVPTEVFHAWAQDCEKAMA